jgi:hypothetical protein
MLDKLRFGNSGEMRDPSQFLMFWVERHPGLFMVALADICREIRKKGD